MTNRVAVSVIIPFYNRSKTIRRALESVIAQSYTDWECLVVDDGSSEEEKNNLIRIVEEIGDPRICLEHLTDNKGGGAARNCGIEMTSGQFIAFLDSDDEWLPQKLQQQFTHSISEQKAFVSCQSIVHHDGGVGIMPQMPIDEQSIGDYLFVQGGWLPTPSFFIDRQILGEIRFDESLLRHQDYDLLFNLEIRGIRPDVLMKPLVRVHWEDLASRKKAVHIENSKHFALSRRKHFSRNAYNCFLAKFVVIPTIKSTSRAAMLPLALKYGISYITNSHLGLEVLSNLIFKDSRLLVHAGRVRNAFKKNVRL